MSIIFEFCRNTIIQETQLLPRDCTSMAHYSGG